MRVKISWKHFTVYLRKLKAYKELFVFVNRLSSIRQATDLRFSVLTFQGNINYDCCTMRARKIHDVIETNELSKKCEWRLQSQ